MSLFDAISPVECAVLRCLIERPNHGYELQKVLAEFRHVFPMNNINVYPLLRGLEQQGMIASRTEVVHSRMRKIYEISEEGRAALHGWLDVEPDSSLPGVRDTVSFKLLLATPGEHAFPWLKDAIVETEAEAQRLRAALEKNHEQLNDVTELASREQIDIIERRAAFLVKMLALVEARPVPKAALATDGHADALSRRPPRPS